MGKHINNSAIMVILLKLLKIFLNGNGNKDGNQDGIIQLLCDIYSYGHF